MQRSGLTPDELYKQLDREKQSAEQAMKAQSAQQLAGRRSKKASSHGSPHGVLVSSKIARFCFKNGMKGDLAANTEIMSAALKYGLTDAVETINGVGGEVSDADLKIAQGHQAARARAAIEDHTNHHGSRCADQPRARSKQYEDYVDKTLSGEPSELRYQLSGMPSAAPADKVKMLAAAQSDPSKAIEYRAFLRSGLRSWRG